MEEKRLIRSRTNKMICGVCGGIGEYHPPYMGHPDHRRLRKRTHSLHCSSRHHTRRILNQKTKNQIRELSAKESPLISHKYPLLYWNEKTFLFPLTHMFLNIRTAEQKTDLIVKPCCIPSHLRQAAPVPH